MAAEQEQKNHSGLEAVQETLQRLGVPDNADWMALVLFARNIVTAMDMFTEDQKGDLQAKIFETMGKRSLDRKQFLSLVSTIQDFLLENPRMSDLRSQLATERQGYTALYEEMARVFAEIQESTLARQDSIQRLGADTEQSIAAAASRAEVLTRLRGMVNGMVAHAREEARTWQERANQLERTANFDPLLSELYSRRALDAQFSVVLERCAKSNTPVSLMFLDVDHFKNVNDTYGHQMGDGVLRVLAAILSAHALQFSGYAARFGGEELVVLCEGLTEKDALTRAERIRADVANCPFILEGYPQAEVPPLSITVSIGVAQIGPGQTVSDLILAADQAMYAAKTQGRNRVLAYSTLMAARRI